VQRAAGQPNINAQEYSNFRIPFPPKLTQQKIVDLLHAAYETKRQKERQALTLLSTIDDVLLAELCVTRKSNTPNVIENRIFRTAFHKLTGQRFDPLYHLGDIFHFVREAKCDLVRLGDLASYFLTGFAAGRGDQSDEGGAVIQIRPTNISNDRELVFNRNVTIAAAELKTRKLDVLKRGEVLFNNTNSQEQVGKTVYFDLHEDYFCSNHITRIASKGDQLNAQYLGYVLNLYQRKKVFFRLCTNWNNQSGVGVDMLEKIPIPLPNPKHQALIVAKLENIRDKASKFRFQAIEELQQAKSEIEALILGKEVNR
jgi:type I restriction enzyme S subunit